ncbi:MAG: lysophospholipid acyltransferase family protein [Brevinematales bacterium]
MIDEKKKDVTSRKRGNALGYFIFKVTVRFLGLRVAYFLLYFVCLYYLIFDYQAVKSSLAYINKRFPNTNFLLRLWYVYKLFINQGMQLIDRYASLSCIVKFDTSIEGFQHLKDIMDNNEKGFILLTAHFGNWQTAITSLKYLNRKVYLVMKPEDNIAIEKVLGIRKKDDYIGFISSEDGPETVIKIINAIEKGSIVSIMGDRKYDFDYVGVNFLNYEAYFPCGAFSIAASLECPIVTLFSPKTGLKSYIVNVENIIYPKYVKHENKKEQLKVYIQEFANILEKYIDKYPFQCFIFHNIWKE